MTASANAHGFTIRPARQADVEALTDVITRSYAELYPDWYPEDLLAVALPLMSQANPKLVASGTYYLAQRNGRILGCGGWTAEAPGSGRVTPALGHVRHFATHPEFVRQGVGRALIARCVADCRRRAIARLSCKSSLPAEAFYKSVGFDRVRAIKVPLPDGTPFPAVLMRRDIHE